MNSNSSGSAGGKIATSSAEGLANVLAFGAAFFATPPLHSLIVEPVQDYTARFYGYGFDDLTSIGLFLGIAGTVFFTTRMTIGTALVAGVTALVIRFLV